jgi:uncharacterized protein YcgI (DUF1989 family)
MAVDETRIVNSVILDASKQGARLFRNVRGAFYTMDGVRALIDAAKALNPDRIMKAIKMLRNIRAGLSAAGSSDLIGFRPLVITQDMVGSTIAVFTACEIKTETGTIRPEQTDFINFVLKNGGFAGIARSPEDAKRIMNYPVDN